MIKRKNKLQKIALIMKAIGKSNVLRKIQVMQGLPEKNFHLIEKKAWQNQLFRLLYRYD